MIMLSDNLMLSISRLFASIKPQRFGVILGAVLFISFFQVQSTSAQTCIFNNFIKASDNPFASCLPGTDTIIIRDSFAVDINYEPIIGGVPFEGIFLIDGGVISWTSNVWFKLGYAAKVILINGGLLNPVSSNAPDCNSFRALYFDTKKTVNCNGIGAPHAFSDVNNAGCVNEIGICCNAFIVETDSSGNYNDLTLCQPGDTAHLSVLASGTLGYSYLWTPNIGPAAGPYPVAPNNTTVYSVNMSAVFDPYGAEPPYLLTCGGSVTLKINAPIQVSANATSVPCAGVPTGSIALTVSGGTAGYSYLWSNGATTKNLSNIPAGTYTVTVKDAKGCEKSFSATVLVEDNTPPTLTCPGNATGTADPGVCTTLIPNINAVFSDNCPTVGVAYQLSGATIASGAGQLSNTVPFSSGVTIARYLVDDGANSVSCTFTVTVSDTQSPTASNPATLSGISCQAAVPAPNMAVVTNEADNCGTPMVAHVSDVVASGSGCPGDPLTILRSYRVSDVAGNSILVTQTILVADNVAPTFTFVPGAIVVNCESIPSVGTPAASDNCAGVVSITYLGEQRTNGSCPDTYSLLRQWRATDNCGNSTLAQQTITVQDITAPVFTSVPASITVSCESIPTVGAPLASDNCDAGISINYNGQTRADGPCLDSYTLRRTWTASDNCGNTAAAEQVIVVQDFTQPVFTSVPANVTVSCESIPAVGTALASDNCDTQVSIVYSGQVRTNGACPDSYSLRRQWTATDNCGNSRTTEQIITVQDITKPVFTSVPADVTVQCGAIPAVGNPIATDNCSVSVAINFVDEVRTNGACPDTYTLRRRWMATDACGNTAMATQNLSVKDDTPPVFTFVPANVTLSCDAIPPVGTPAAVDNCAVSTTINYDGQVRVDGSCPDNYSLVRRWTAADNCGNTRTVEQIISIEDKSSPVFTAVPADATVSCDAIPAVGTPAASDNCDSNVSITYSGETKVNGSCTDSYTLKRRWTATDNCGNTKTAEQSLFVRDQSVPVFTFIPVDATVNCEAIPSLGSPLASDNCDGNVTISFLGVTQNSGNCASGGTVLRRWMATDNCGNTALAEQMLTVQDTTKPKFTLVPADVTVGCDAIPDPGMPVATDNCTSTVDIAYDGETRTNGACADSYTLRRRWTAVDVCGNTDVAEQMITVLDQTKPVFTAVPANTTVSCDAVPAAGAPAASDNCDTDVTITYDGEQRTNGACPDSYILLRKWAAIDNCGNSAVATQELVVQDITKPVFTFIPANVTVACEAVPVVGAPTASDNCTSNVVISFNGETRADGLCNDTYVLSRQWTISDDCGNTDSAVQQITVQDITPPAFTFVAPNVTVNCESVPAVQPPTATDACTVDVLISYNGETRDNGSCTDTYVIKRQWTAVDRCGNTNSTVQIITVRDLEAPVFTYAPSDVVVDCDQVPAVETPTATDNCAANVQIIYEGETRQNGPCLDTYMLTRRWTATDNCGNTQTTKQIIQVQDASRPTFSFVPDNLTVDCANIPALEEPLASDNCTSTVAVTYDGETRADGACPDTYTLTRQWTATDNCGNTELALQVITVQDLVAPVFVTVPDHVTVECDAVPGVGSPQASDNCTADVVINYEGEVRLDGPCPHGYVLRRTWMAMDNCGNTATAEQLLTVQDNTNPVFVSVPADATVECENVPAVATPIATDNCTTDLTLTFDGEERQDGACPDTYTLIRRWTVTDGCGNSAQAAQSISVSDQTEPAFTFVPANITVDCDAIPALETPTATDNCAAQAAISFDGETRISGACPDSYSLVRRWTVSDNCGNTATAEQTLTVQDVQPPVFLFVPADATVNCEAIPGISTPTASDNCDQNVNITVSTQLVTNGDCSSGGMLIRTWTAVDNCGNSAIAEQHLTVQDTTRPVFTLVPEDVTVNCEAIPNVETPEAADNCSLDVVITFDGEDRVDGPCPDTYNLRRRWTVKDVCGNSQTAEQVITVRDLTAPVFIDVPVNATVSCDGVPPVGTPTASDNCDADVAITFDSEVRLDGACPDSYQLERQWTATDNCGNAVSVKQVITVQDITPPVFTSVPMSLTSSCAAIPAVGTPTATDNCDAGVTIIFDGETKTNGSCPGNYTLRRQWTASDNCGNAVSTEQIITVQDNTPPAFSFVPASATVSCDAVPGLANPIASDNCTVSVTITFDGELRTDGPCLDTYILRRSWTAVDNCGNTTTAEQLLTVRDITPPIFTYAPLDTLVGCDHVPPAAVPTATDNCDASVQIVYDGETVLSSTSPSTYKLERRWTAIDNCGNSVQAVQVLSVRDTVAPLIQCPTNIAVNAQGALCTAVASFEAPFTSDNCTLAPAVSYSIPTGSVFQIGTTMVVLQSTDESGNTATCSFNVVVADTTAPKLVGCPGDITVTTPDNGCTAMVNWTAPTVTDACDTYPIIPVPDIQPGTAFSTGFTTVTYTAQDSSGNKMTCSFEVTVNETVPPVLANCPSDINLQTDSCTAMANWIPPTATDNCQLDTLMTNFYPGHIFPETKTTVTYTAIDVWGNSTSCSFDVTVVDVVDPQFSGCPSDLTVNSNSDCEIAVDWQLPTATDNCDPNPVITAFPNPGDKYPVGYTNVFVLVEDPSGNKDTCVFKITVIGPPLGFANTPVDQSFIGCEAIATWTPPVPTGVCAPATVESNFMPGDTFPVGLTPVIYTVTDTLGNTATITFNISVTESIPPQFDCPASPVIVDISGAILTDAGQFVTGTDTISTCDGVELQFDLPLASDNCGTPIVAQMAGQKTGKVFEIGQHNLLFQTTDDAGNTAMCSVQIEVLPLSQLNPQISDKIGCEGDDIILSTPVIPGATYIWNGPLAPYPDNNNLIVENLKPSLTGIYTVQARVNGCLTPLDSALVRQAILPDAIDDLDFEVETGTVLDSIDVVLNDILEYDDFKVTLLSQLTGLSEIGNGLFSYQAGPDNGHVSFIYQLCSEACPDLCDQAVVTITVRETFCTYIPNIITPNEDGINDYLEIPCLGSDLYPQNSLVIYNQWGDKVYEASPYDNSPDKAWRGTLDGKIGQNLPDGTYFYFFQPDPNKSALSGFVEIFR